MVHISVVVFYLMLVSAALPEWRQVASHAAAGAGEKTSQSSSCSQEERAAAFHL